MSKTHSKQEIEKRIDDVIEEVNLQKCRGTMIGGSDPIFNHKGLSGGERKRLALASELLDVSHKILYKLLS